MAVAISLVVVKMQALVVVLVEAEGDERAMNEPWIGVEEERLVTIEDEVDEVKPLDDKCILGYFREHLFVNIVKEWKTKGGKQP